MTHMNNNEILKKLTPRQLEWYKLTLQRVSAQPDAMHILTINSENWRKVTDQQVEQLFAPHKVSVARIG